MSFLDKLFKVPERVTASDGTPLIVLGTVSKYFIVAPDNKEDIIGVFLIKKKAVKNG